MNRLRPIFGRHPDLAAYSLVIAVGLALRALWIVIDHRPRVANDSLVFLASARSWLDGTGLPIHRERPALFSLLWAPLLDLPYSGVLIAVLQGGISCLAACAFLWALRRFGLGPRLALGGTLVLVLLPAPIYYEHVLLSESLAHSATAALVAVVAWSVLPLHPVRLGVCALAFLVLAASLRNSFLLMFAAFCGAALLIGAIRFIRAGRLSLRTTAAAVGAVALGATTGLLGMSAVQGAMAGEPPLRQALNSSAMSAYNGIFKFGGLIDCSTLSRPLDHAQNSICSNIADVSPATPTFDDFMAFGAVHSDWAQSSDADFEKWAPEYRSAARGAVVDDPLGAASLVYATAVGTLFPVSHEYFSTGPSPAELLPDIAPRILVPADFGPQASDVLFRAADFQDSVRALAVISTLILLITARSLRRAFFGWILWTAWVGYWIAFAATGVPTPRFLFPMDPVILAALLLSVHAVIMGKSHRVIAARETDRG